MGLDMYLTGDKFKRTQYARDDKNNFLRDEDGGIIPINEVFVDGFKCTSEKLELGYWRKHAPLHDFIVRAFADGEDNCRPINLHSEDLRWIAKVLRGEDGEYGLPSNEDVVRGCFFGNEEWWDELRERADEDAEIFEKAASWLDDDQQNELFWHSVEYQASW
tara:strand:+ start:280 stop:765 length:486 start_codon:yes stop_codon:yes gene_type:complete